MEVLFTALALSAVCLLLSLPGLMNTSRRRYVFCAILFVFVLTISTDLRHIFRWIPKISGHYNWTGKALELLVSVIAIALLIRFDGWRREAFGLRLAFNSGTGKDVLRFLVPVLLFEVVALWFLVPGSVPTFEDHLFQLTAPGLTEELAFRGVFLALLDKAFLSRVRMFGADIGWGAVVTSIVFGLWHGLDVSAHFKISVEVAPMVIPTLGGFVLAWCRARSGSLILPIVAHSGMNEVANLIALVKSA